MNQQVPTPQKKKGLSNLAWIGIGCAVVLILFFVAAGISMWWLAGKAKDMAADFEANPELAAARLIVKASPELEEVSSDEDAGTITVRNTATGEEVTVNYKDLRDGKISFSSGEKEVTLEATGEGEDGQINIRSSEGDLSFSTGARADAVRPDWVPLYPECTAENQYTQQRGDGVTGSVRCTTPDSLDEVMAFFRQALEPAGYQVRVNEISGDDGQVAMMSANSEPEGRTVMVNATREAEQTVVAVTYNEKLPSGSE